MSKVLTSIKIDPWMLAALDIVRERDPKIKGKTAPDAFPERIKNVTTRTWIIEQLVENYLEKQGLTPDSPEVIKLVQVRNMLDILEG